MDLTMKTKIIGNKNSFAVEFEVTGRNKSFLYGKICYWINNIQIGEYTQGATLSDLIGFIIPSLVKDNGNRVHHELFELKLDELIYRLEGRLFGDDNQYDEIAKVEMWGRFNINMDIDIFRDCSVYLVESDITARVTFSNKEKEINQIYLEKKVVHEVFYEMYIELNRIYDEFI